MTDKTDDDQTQNAVDAAEEVLRPSLLRDFRGQPQATELIEMAVAGARQRGEAPDHTLLYGPPGLGKTTLASILAREMGGGFKVVMGPSITRAGDLASILVGLEPNDVLLIDEIHRLPPQAGEIAYGAMEDFRLDIVTGDQGGQARAVSIPLPRFCLVGATTRPGMLAGPLRNRFHLTVSLVPYGNEDMTAIVARSAGILGIDLDEGAAAEVALRSRGTPRLSNGYLRRIRDHAAYVGTTRVGLDLVRAAFDRLGVDADGLRVSDRRYLDVLSGRFAGRPVGLKTLAAALGEDIDTLEHEVEPYLVQHGFVDRTARGRLPGPRRRPQGTLGV